jgi:hypothetical protein
MAKVKAILDVPDGKFCYVYDKKTQEEEIQCEHLNKRKRDLFCKIFKHSDGEPIFVLVEENTKKFRLKKCSQCLIGGVD